MREINSQYVISQGGEMEGIPSESASQIDDRGGVRRLLLGVEVGEEGGAVCGGGEG